MANAQAIISKLNKALSKVQACDRPVYKRVYTIIGGDALIGAPDTTDADTELTPRPAVSVINASSRVLIWGDGRVQVGDLLMVTSTSSITREELEDKNLRVVFKDADGEEEFNIVAYSPMMFGGTSVGFNMLLRKVGVRK